MVFTVRMNGECGNRCLSRGASLRSDELNRLTFFLQTPVRAAEFKSNYGPKYVLPESIACDVYFEELWVRFISPTSASCPLAVSNSIGAGASGTNCPRYQYQPNFHGINKTTLFRA